MILNDVNNLLNVGANNNNEPVDKFHDGTQHDDSTSETHIDRNESTPNRVERNTQRVRNLTPMIWMTSLWPTL